MNKIVPSGAKMLLFGICLFIGSLTCFSQNTAQKSPFWSKVRFGGGIGVGFNNAGYNASIAPSAIYQVTDNFSAGINTNFIFSKAGDNRFSAYGGGVIALYNPINFLQLSSEFEQLRVNQSSGSLENDFWSPALFLGIGYTNRFSTIGIRYNVFQGNEDSIYLNAWVPFVRFYF